MLAKAEGILAVDTDPHTCFDRMTEMMQIVLIDRRIWSSSG